MQDARSSKQAAKFHAKGWENRLKGADSPPLLDLLLPRQSDKENKPQSASRLATARHPPKKKKVTQQKHTTTQDHRRMPLSAIARLELSLRLPRHPLSNTAARMVSSNLFPFPNIELKAAAGVSNSHPSHE